jgi:hypothetical protein
MLKAGEGVVAMIDRNREVLEGLWPTDGVLALSAEDEHALRADDYVLEMPQSGERLIARETRIYGSPFDPPAWRSPYTS